MIRWFGLRRARMLSQAVPFILIFGVTFFAGSLSVSIAQHERGGRLGAHAAGDAGAFHRARATRRSPSLARAGSGEPVDSSVSLGSSPRCSRGPPCA